MFSVVFIFSVLLTICAAQAQDPLVWASIEAQGAYYIGEDVGKKCSPIPNSFQMRADGAWDPASEFDLTGDFDDDCGIHITLSIPTDESEKEKLKKDMEILTDERKQLEFKKKEVEESERELEKDKTAHEESIKSFEESKKNLETAKQNIDEEKMKIKKEEDKVSQKKLTIEEKKKIIKDREDKLKLKREEYEKKKKDYDDQFKSLKEEKNALTSDINNLGDKKKLLKKMYESCEKFTGQMLLNYMEILTPKWSTATMWYCSIDME